MRIFEKFPSNQICPICNTNENTPCGLIGKEITDNDEEKEFEEECVVVHIACLNLVLRDIGRNQKMISHSEPIKKRGNKNDS